MESLDELFTNQSLELRRGTIVLATLNHLHGSFYGYRLLQKLQELGFLVDAGTLYPLLRRLEKQGVLDSRWDTTDIRPRKFYQLNNKGRLLYQRLASEWLQTSEKLVSMIKKEQS